MRDEFRPAIEALQRDLADLEKKVAETKATINRLCELAGAPPLYPDINTPSGSPSGATSIRSDSFYGKVIVTAAREYLEMRKASNLGPASPRDIYVALQKGGFAFDTENEANRVTGIRNTLRKASQIFHRLPNGEYGLLKWYPNAKPRRQDDDEGVPGAVEQKKRGRPPKSHPKKRGRPPKSKASAKIVEIGIRSNQNPDDESEAADTMKASAA